jgi:hypothetical protein
LHQTILAGIGGSVLGLFSTSNPKSAIVPKSVTRERAFYYLLRFAGAIDG